MNQDVFEGKWKEMRGQVKEWWGKLTDDDLEQVNGKADQLIGLLQQKYGYTKEQAEEEFNRRLEKYLQEPVEAEKSPYTNLALEGTGLDHAMPGEPYKSPYVTSEPEERTAKTEEFKSPYATPDMTEVREDNEDMSPYTMVDAHSEK
ncbi:MAG: CsbD family protein [Chloroflexi bacterium]|nr:CsbD family protein [Chloroflexota bacterium]